MYVDITTPPQWDGTTLRAVDLDLDVVRGTTGRVWVDDEDEFAEHRIALATPPRWCCTRPRTCDLVHIAVRGRLAVRRVSAPWLAKVAELTRVTRARQRRAGAGPQRPDQARPGEPALHAAGLAAQRRATYSPRITPDASAIATGGGDDGEDPAAVWAPASPSSDRPR